MGQWGALFGQSAIATAAPSNYQLKGVIVANDERDSVAIIFVEGKPTYAIGIGKELSSNVKLQEVHSDHVIINESGIPKRVDLPHGISPSVGITPAVIVPNFPKNTALAPRS